MKNVETQTYSQHELGGILLAAAFAAFLTPFFGAVVNIAIPSIAESFHVPTDMLALLPTAYLISSVIFLIPAARLADIIGLRRVFLTGLLIGAAGSLIAVFAPSIEVLLCCQVLVGLGFACVVSNALALLSATFPKERRGSAIGMGVAAVYLGLSAGPLLGGVLTGLFGWNSVYVFVCGLCILTAFVAAVSIKREIISAPGEPFDGRGSILYGVVIFLLMFGLTQIPEPAAILMVAAGGVLLIFFITYERKVAYPVFAIRLFLESKVFARGNTATMINFGATYAVSFFMSLYLQVVGLLTPGQAGFVMIAMPVMQMIFSPVAGRLSDKISARFLMTIGMFITAIGMSLFLFAGTEYNQSGIILNLALLGFGMAIFGAPNTNLVLSSVSLKDNGSANSINATMRQMGMVVSMAFATSFLALAYGGASGLSGNPGDLVLAMHMTFALSAVLCFAGVGVSWLAKDKDASGRV